MRRARFRAFAVISSRLAAACGPTASRPAVLNMFGDKARFAGSALRAGQVMQYQFVNDGCNHGFDSPLRQGRHRFPMSTLEPSGVLSAEWRAFYLNLGADTSRKTAQKALFPAKKAPLRRGFLVFGNAVNGQPFVTSLCRDQHHVSSAPCEQTYRNDAGNLVEVVFQWLPDRRSASRARR